MYINYIIRIIYSYKVSHLIKWTKIAGLSGKSSVIRRVIVQVFLPMQLSKDSGTEYQSAVQNRMQKLNPFWNI